MSETDMLTTWGREFAISVDGLVEACGVDAYSIYSEVFGKAPIKEALRAADESQLVRLRDAARAFFEVDTIEVSHMREAVAATLWHWQD